MMHISKHRWPPEWMYSDRRSVRTWTLILVLLATGLTTACASVEPWQKGDLAAEPMQVDEDRCHRFERNVEVYREGAAGANGGKAGGGCGCT